MRSVECGVKSVECEVLSLVERAAESDASTALQERGTVIIIMINKIERQAKNVRTIWNIKPVKHYKSQQRAYNYN